MPTDARYAYMTIVPSELVLRPPHYGALSQSVIGRHSGGDALNGVRAQISADVSSRNHCGMQDVVSDSCRLAPQVATPPELTNALFPNTFEEQEPSCLHAYAEPPSVVETSRLNVQRTPVLVWPNPENLMSKIREQNALTAAWEKQAFLVSADDSAHRRSSNEHEGGKRGCGKYCATERSPPPLDSQSDDTMDDDSDCVHSSRSSSSAVDGGPTGRNVLQAIGGAFSRMIGKVQHSTEDVGNKTSHVVRALPVVSDASRPPFATTAPSAADVQLQTRLPATPVSDACRTSSVGVPTKRDCACLVCTGQLDHLDPDKYCRATSSANMAAALAIKRSDWILPTCAARCPRN